VSVTDAPAHIIPSLFVVPEVSAKVIVGLGNELTVTDADAEEEQFDVELVTVTVYEVVETGETDLLFPVALIGEAQLYVIPVVGFAVRVTASPLQMIPSLLTVPEVSVNVIVGATELTVTAAEAEAAQLVDEFVTVTV
jgi:hypothetical protein